MANFISESVRQKIIDIVSKHGFTAQLKPNGDDQYVKVLMFYSKQLNQTVYIRKDRAVGTDGIPTYFQVAVHPDFFNKAWVSATDGIQEHINSQKKKNLHSSSYYQKFPVTSENNEPCGMGFKIADYDALAKLFQQMSSGKVYASQQPIVPPILIVYKPADLPSSQPILVNQLMPELRDPVISNTVKKTNTIPTRGLIIKSPYIDRILAGTKTWEMRSTHTKVRGPIALIRKGSGQIIGMANLVDSKGPLSDQEKIDNINQHQISIERLQSGDTAKWNVAWILEKAQSLNSPVHYKHRNGAVIWVTLETEIREKLALAITAN
jgi:hypothetical protein